MKSDELVGDADWLDAINSMGPRRLEVRTDRARRGDAAGRAGDQRAATPAAQPGRTRPSRAIAAGEVLLERTLRLSAQLQRALAPPVIPPSITSSAPVM